MRIFGMEALISEPGSETTRSLHRKNHCQLYYVWQRLVIWKTMLSQREFWDSIAAIWAVLISDQIKTATDLNASCIGWVSFRSPAGTPLKSSSEIENRIPYRFALHFLEDSATAVLLVRSYSAEGNWQVNPSCISESSALLHFFQLLRRRWCLST